MEANKCNTDFLNRLLQLPCVLVKGKLWGLPVFSKCSQEKKTTNTNEKVTTTPPHFIFAGPRLRRIAAYTHCAPSHIKHA